MQLLMAAYLDRESLTILIGWLTVTTDWIGVAWQDVGVDVTEPWKGA